MNGAVAKMEIRTLRSSYNCRHPQPEGCSCRFLNQASEARLDPSAIFLLPQTSVAAALDQKRREQSVYAVTVPCPCPGSKLTPRRNVAQAIRASLAAKATTTTLRCARAS